VERMKLGSKCGVLYLQAKDTKVLLLQQLEQVVLQQLDVLQVCSQDAQMARASPHGIDHILYLSGASGGLHTYLAPVLLSTHPSKHLWDTKVHLAS
jgi:hypothetical protein